MVTDNKFNPDWDQTKPFLDRIAELETQRDELLEALKCADAMLSGANMNTNVVQYKARAAIAKATGEMK